MGSSSIGAPEKRAARVRSKRSRGSSAPDRRIAREVRAPECRLSREPQGRRLLGVATRLVRIVVDALRVEQLTQFWAAALDWELLPHGHGEGVVRSREEPRMELVVVPTSVAKHQKNRLHLLS